MKEETKQKLNKAKEFVSEHESIITTGLWVAGCFILGRCIGNGIANCMNNAYQNGFGVTYGKDGEVTNTEIKGGEYNSHKIILFCPYITHRNYSMQINVTDTEIEFKVAL